ncbi:hypothetical protein [Microbacterium sp. CH-015]|uniref:hypothetical protein n=1 Tax=Microbacterium sp. CH-015 TaxID=3406734 RepID=UPI003C753738
MSGPKGYGYSVVSEAEMRRREDEARAGRCEQHVVTLAGLTGQLRFYEASIPQPLAEPAQRTHESLIAWELALQKAIGHSESRLREAAAIAIDRRLNSSRHEVDASGVTLGARKPASRPTDTPLARTPDVAILSNEIDKVVQVIAQLQDQVVRDELAASAERIVAMSDVAQAKGDLLTLKTRTASALQTQDLRRLATEAVLDVAHVASPEADALRARAEQVASTQDVADIRRGVTETLSAVVRASDAEFVEAALEAVLDELGFTIGAGFELADLGRSVAVANHADHPGFGVRVQLNPANGMIYTRLVSQRASTPEEDARAEDETCVKVHSLAKNLAKHGVAADLKSERLPGEAPVERQEDRSTSTRRKRPRAHTSPQTRTAR